MPFRRKYNTLLVAGTTAIRVPIVKRAVVDFAVGADWTPAAGDVKILVDNTAAANVTNLPTAIASGNGAVWEFILTAAELSCKQAVVTIVDSATKAIEDQAFIVETFGNASAMWPADLSDIIRLGLTALPAIAAEGAGGLFTRGTGAGQINQAANGMIDTNPVRLNNVAASLLNLEKSASVIYRGSVTGAATTTTLIDSGLTQADTDWWKGRIVIFTSGKTYQATDITAFDPALDKLTFTALTGAPSGGDTYVII